MDAENTWLIQIDPTAADDDLRFQVDFYEHNAELVNPKDRVFARNGMELWGRGIVENLPLDLKGNASGGTRATLRIDDTCVHPIHVDELFPKNGAFNPVREVFSSTEQAVRLGPDEAEELENRIFFPLTLSESGAEAYRRAIALARNGNLTDPPAIVSPGVLLLALAELGRDTGRRLSGTAEVVFEALGGHPGFEEVRKRYVEWERAEGISHHSLDSSRLAAGGVRVTKETQDLFQTARSFVDRVTPSHIVSTRHLLLAILLSPADDELIHLFDIAGATRPSLARRLLDRLDEYSIPNENIQVWSDTLGPVIAGNSSQDSENVKALISLDGSLAAYRSDLARADDDLGVGRDAKAFATVICARHVEPPLSIGLFGAWGSGKSTFIQLLKDAIDKVSKDPANKGKEHLFCRNVKPIEFNAWHYVDTELWPSLVSHIFERLSPPPKPESKSSETALASLDQSMRERELAQRKYEAAQAAYSHELAELDRKKAESDAKIANARRVTARDALDAVGASIPESDKAKIRSVFGIDEATSAARDVQAALADSKTLVGRLLAALRVTCRDPWTLLAVALVLGAVVGFGWLASALGEKGYLDAQAKAVTAAISQLAALVSGAALWIAQQNKKVTTAVAALEDANAKIQVGAERRVRAEVEGYAAAEAKVEQARQEALEAAAKLEDANRKVEQAKVEYDETTPQWKLANFLRERAGSADYRKHLGVVALVRRDFEQLSELMRGLRPDLDPHKTVERVDRIVLFIDDLDRCPPKRVVEVLRAVHLLLSFDLFVVVVAVDSRWVTGSLADQFEFLGDETRGGGRNGDVATPQDYLEKIFQIPFWLTPMSKSSFEKLVAGLTRAKQKPKEETTDDGRTREPDPPPAAVPTPAPVATEAGQSASPKEPEGTTASEPGGPEEKPSVAPEPATPEASATPAPPLLTLTEGEIETIRALRPILDRSPRTVKRFVNVYQIIRTNVDEASRQTFFGPPPNPPQYRAVLMLLAVVTGKSEFAPELVRALLETASERVDFEFTKQLRAARPDSRDWDFFVDDLEAFLKALGRKRVPVPTLAWTERVCRFAFRSDELLATVRDKEATTQSAEDAAAAPA